MITQYYIKDYNKYGQVQILVILEKIVKLGDIDNNSYYEVKVYIYHNFFLVLLLILKMW